MPPGRLKRPLLKLNRLVGHSSAKDHMSKLRLGDTAALEDASTTREAEQAMQERMQELERKREHDELRRRREVDEENARSQDPPEIRFRYGRTTEESSVLGRRDETLLADLPGTSISTQPIRIVARLHHVRAVSAKLAFLVFRQQVDTLQGVLECRDGVVSERFVRWAEHLRTECVVRVEGVLQAPKEPVASCSIRDRELRIDAMHVLVILDEAPGIDACTIDRVEEDGTTRETAYAHPMHTRTANRVSFLRTPAMQSVIRIKSTICQLYRSALMAQGFIEVHTPTLQAAATESGAEVFQVRYFDRKAILAQSPQLAKQLCMSADLERVFEIGGVFRAENSNTHRHLTEYVSLDLEMVLREDYHEAMALIDGLLKTILRGVYEQRRREIDMVKAHFPHKELEIPDETVVLPFNDAVQLLNDSGWKEDDGNEASPLEDLSTPAEIQLGKLVREKFRADYYILDKFPRSARPFYTHLDDADSQYTNSFDIFLHGQEIATGGQRVHDAHTLKARMEEANIDPSDMWEYLQGFDLGVLPHAGCGIGLERLLCLMLDLKDVRNATLFPRDPKSLPATPPSRRRRVAHPEADTIQYAIDYRTRQDENGEADRDQLLPPTVENLIASYGDATNTSWLDDRYQVWHHAATGAAIGFAEENGYALAMGNPLCDARQYGPVIAAFLRDLRTPPNLRPIWLLVSAAVEDILSRQLGWNTMSCVAEDRVAVDEARRVTKKERQAKEAGVTVHVLDKGEAVPEALRAQCDQRIAAWKAARKGHQQVHITEVRPWVDLPHRRFVWAEDRQGAVAALVVLHDLAPEHGCQIKFALDFPGAPSGTIELAVARAIQLLAAAGVRSVTFGVGATREMAFGAHLAGTVRARVLSQTYRLVAEQLRLYQKSGFRDKFGAVEDAVYICYPHLGLGVSGARTLVKFFEDAM